MGDDILGNDPDGSIVEDEQIVEAEATDGFLSFLVVLDDSHEDVDEVPEIRFLEESPIINILYQRLFQTLIEGREDELHAVAALAKSVRLAELLRFGEVEVVFHV